MNKLDLADSDLRKALVTSLRAPLCLALFSVVHATPPSSAPPRVVPCPARDCLVPDVAVDAAGAVHLVYGTSQKQAFYQRSVDDGATWSAPLRLNDAQNVTTTMGERGPKLSVPSPNIVYVVWLDLWFPGAQTFARMVCSTDGGATFNAPVAISEHWGIDGVTLAANAQGGCSSRTTGEMPHTRDHQTLQRPRGCLRARALTAGPAGAPPRSRHCAAWRRLRAPCAPCARDRWAGAPFSSPSALR